MPGETTYVYIIKYALTQGIYKSEVVSEYAKGTQSESVWVKRPGGVAMFRKSEYRATLPEAVKAVKDANKKKITALLEQIEMLKSVDEAELTKNVIEE